MKYPSSSIVAKLRKRAHGSFDFHAQQRALPDVDEKISHVLRVQVFAETALPLRAGQPFLQLVAIPAHGFAQRKLAKIARVADFADQIAEQTAALEVASLGFLDQFVEIGLQRRFGVHVRALQMTVKLRDERLDVVLDDLRAERLLAREVIVKRALRHADAPHQLLKTRAVIALLHQEGHPLIQQLLSKFLDVAPAHV